MIFSKTRLHVQEKNLSDALYKIQSGYPILPLQNAEHSFIWLFSFISYFKTLNYNFKIYSMLERSR